MKHFFLFLILLVSLESWAQLQTQFKKIVDSIYNQHPEAIGILVHVEAPNQSISWSYAKGISEKLSTTPLTAQQPVLIASNTKPYVAAAILRLVEKKKFTLDQSIATLLSTQTTSQLKKSGYNLQLITPRHLLSHTSGIQDYVDESYFQHINEHPQYQWTRNEQIERSLAIGKSQEVGTHFSYGDINYLLLTEIIEQQMQQPFYIAIRTLLKYQALGLNHTWFFQLEDYPVHTLPLAHQYAAKLQWNSYQLNSSWDLYGGGGIAATAKDAALFFQYLFEGKIIEDKSLLQKMYTYVLPPDQSKYCLGIFNFDLGFPAYYHGGWWGTDVIYSPTSNATVTVFTLQKEFQHTINPYIGKEFLTLLFKQEQLFSSPSGVNEALKQ